MITGKLRRWFKHFDDRQLNEIQFSQIYLTQFNHGTDGHNAKIIIAKFADILDKLEEASKSDSALDKMLTILRKE